jgi:hypothetical protein
MYVSGRQLVSLGCWALAAISVGAAASCAPDARPTVAEEDVSAVRQAQIATRVFRKLVGRDPTAAELRALRNATLAEMVDRVLALPEFRDDGFFSFQRDRLLLHRDGDETWRKNSLRDYCALKLELADVARADADGAGYYELLRYRDRWIGLTQASFGMPVGCLTLKIGELKRAMDIPGAPDVTPSAVGRRCAQSLRSRPNLLADLGALPVTDDGRAFVTSAPGKKAVLDVVKERMFKPMPGLPDPEITLVTAPEGTPHVRGFAGTPNDRCETVDALGDAALFEGADPIGYLRVRVPAALAGVHGSMYWLSRHPTTQKNRQLNRARQIFFSYLCTEISPAMAAVGGGEPQEIEELKPFFDPADEHVKSSANCYNCHTQVQPLANYFGELTRGIDYGAPGAGASSYLQRGEGFRRPGGLWLGEKFHPAGAREFGMEGLADLLSDLAPAHDCIARNTWSTLIGRGHPLVERERAAAVAAFRGDGTFRFVNLLRHLAVESPRGKAFFEGGEQALAAIPPPVSEDCRDVPSVPADAADAHQTLLVASCSGCHSGSGNRGFYQRVDGVPVWKPERLVGPGLRYRHIAEFLHNGYCRVRSDSMPIGGWPEGDVEAQKKKALCFFAGRRNEAARTSDDPTIRALDGAACPIETEAVAGPHPVMP